MKISPLAINTAKRIAENLQRSGHCEIFVSDIFSIELAIQGVIDHVQSGGFTGESLGTFELDPDSGNLRPVLDSENA